MKRFIMAQSMGNIMGFIITKLYEQCMALSQNMATSWKTIEENFQNVHCTHFGTILCTFEYVYLIIQYLTKSKTQKY